MYRKNLCCSMLMEIRVTSRMVHPPAALAATVCVMFIPLLPQVLLKTLMQLFYARFQFRFYWCCLYFWSVTFYLNYINLLLSSCVILKSFCLFRDINTLFLSWRTVFVSKQPIDFGLSVFTGSFLLSILVSCSVMITVIRPFLSYYQF